MNFLSFSLTIKMYWVHLKYLFHTLQLKSYTEMIIWFYDLQFVNHWTSLMVDVNVARMKIAFNHCWYLNGLLIHCCDLLKILYLSLSIVLVQFSHSVLSNSYWPTVQHTRCSVHHSSGACISLYPLEVCWYIVSHICNYACYAPSLLAWDLSKWSKQLHQNLPKV